MNSWINLDALWQIVVVSLLAGAGLPALFAVGLRALSMPGNRVQTAGAGTGAGGAATGADSDQIYGGNPLGLVLGVLCFAIVLAAIAYGIYLIVASS